MPEFASGLIQGGDALSRDRYRDAEVQRLLFGLLQAQQQQKAQEQAKSVPARANAFLPLGPPPVQPPAPGQPSVPMQPPSAAGPSPFGPPGGQPSPMMAPQSPVPMLSGGPQGAPQGAPPPMAGGMGAPGAGASPVAPPAAPDSWKNMADAGAPSPGQAPQKITAQMWDLGESLKKMQDANVSPADQAAYIPYLADMIKQHNDTVAAQARIDLEAQQTIAAAAEAAHRTAEAKKLNLEMASGGAGKKLPAEMANTIFAAGGDPNKGLDQQPPEVIARARKLALAEETKKGTSVNITLASGAKLDQETLDQMADQYLAGDKSVATGLGYGNVGAGNRAALRKTITRMAKERGMSGKDIAMQLAEYSGIQAGERTVGQRSANIEMAGNEARSLAELALTASGKVDRAGWQGLASAEQAVQKKTASPELRAFVVSNTSLINAYARAISPSGVPTVSDKDHAREMLDVSFAKGDYEAAVGQLLKEIDAALASPGQTKGAMRERFGTTGAAASPTPSGLREFKNEEDAKKAKLEPGTKVIIGGRKATWVE